MRKKTVLYCEQCGGAAMSRAGEFIVFERLTFCTVECREDYRAEDEARREERAKRLSSKPRAA